MAKNNNRINAKDLINVGIYTAFYLVVIFILGMLNVFVFLYPISYFYIPIIAGIPFMLFITKTEKFGMVFIMSCIMGVFWFLMGYTWLALIAYVATGLIADLVFKSGKYKSFKTTVIGYWIFSLGFIGCQMPMWVMADTYMADIKTQYGEEMINQLVRFMPWWIGIAAIGIILVGAILGTLLGRKMLKKHFERAGIA